MLAFNIYELDGEVAMGGRPKVTIGLPFFNPGEYFKDAVRSVFAQTFDEWELIAIDDGSTDNTYDLCMRISDPRVKCIRDGKRKGLPARLNEIAARATGDFIARMDADDIMHPERLERQVAVLVANESVDVVATGAYIIDQSGNLLRVYRGKQPTALDIFAWGGYLHPSIMGRLAWFRENPYSLDVPRAEDRELFARVVGRAEFFTIPDPLYVYRWHGHVSSGKLITGYRSERKVLLKYGPQKLGWFLTSILLMRSIAKEAVVQCASSFGFGGLINQWVGVRHAAALLPEEKSVFGKVMDLVKAQPVPGW